MNFGPEETNNFIENRESGSKLMLRRNGRGSYLRDVNSGGKVPQSQWTAARRKASVHGAGEKTCLAPQRLP